ncbi:MAG TPA: hypothetical protein VFZ93_02685 [Albitalea sp.]
MAAACAACVIAGCATGPRDDGATSVVRTRPPLNYQTSVADYFDLMLPAPQAQRRLAIGEPEASDCALYGTGGVHQGWVVPVIYDTSPATASGSKVPAKRPAGARAAAARTSAAGTSAAGPAATTTVNDGIATATLQEVKISGKGYFFWFSSDTIAAVTRRADGCPP